MLGGSGKSGELLKITFPMLAFIPLSSPVIRYSGKGGWLIPSLIFQLPRLLMSVIHEHNQVRKIVKTYGVDIVVSDNRYGLYCRSVHSVFITHQISPVLPAILRWAEYPLYIFIRTLIHRFNECWIPDFADQQQNLGGKLSHRFKLPRNARFVGILSRFNPEFRGLCNSSNEKFELVIILSGPEPQLGIINEMLIRQAQSIPHKTLIISGWRVNPVELFNAGNPELTVVPHLDPDKLSQALLNADVIVCRSGYSSIMDLVALRKTAILVPTPGQPEQQYLAGYLTEKGWFSSVMQHELDLADLMKKRGNQSTTDTRFIIQDCTELPISLLPDKKNR